MIVLSQLIIFYCEKEHSLKATYFLKVFDLAYSLRGSKSMMVEQRNV